MDYDSDTVFDRNRTGRDPEIRNMYRQGKVIERIVDNTQVSVRVQYLDKDGLISKPIPVKQKGSRSTGSFYCPKIGDDVCVTMLPNGSEDGFVDGSFYNADNPPPTTNPDCHHTTFQDGTVIEYAEATSSLEKGSTQGQLTIKSVYPIQITCGSANIVATGPITIKGSLITLDAPTVKVTGNLIVVGSINVAAGKGGTQVTLGGDIQHTGNMNTSGTHTDSKGTHH